MKGVIEHFRTQYEAVSDRLPGHEIDWLQNARQAAIAQFLSTGLPTRCDEDWKYTNVLTMARRNFEYSDSSCLGLLPEDLDLFVCRDLDCHLMVFVNGRYAAPLSEPGTLPAGVTVTSLAAALKEDPAAFETLLGKYADPTVNGFAALNTAFSSDGVYINVPDNCVIDAPIHVLFVSTSSETPTMSHPRNLIITGANSRAVIVESYAGIGSGEYMTNVTTELVVGDNAHVEHYYLQEESLTAFHVAALQVEQGRDSSFISHCVATGGHMARTDINVNLAAEGAECTLNGLYIIDGRQHVDFHSFVDHARPNTHSHEFYKGILDGRARAVFNGKVYVRPDSQKITAEQSNSNLLMSAQAEVDTKPQLEIYADDVQCSHGATVGQLDETMLFYLRSRGISEEIALGMLTYGFAHDVIARMDIEPIRQRLENLLSRRIPDRELVKEII